MNAAVLKGLLALLAAGVFLAVSVAIFLTRRGLPSALQALGIGCFGVMALTHVFDAFSILPAFGWGQPHTLGHLIDLVSAMLGVYVRYDKLLAVASGTPTEQLGYTLNGAPSNNRWGV